MKPFFVGLLVGAGLTLVLLQLWGTHLVRVLGENAQPRILRPFRISPLLSFASDQQEHLPSVWVPETSGEAHQSWGFHTLDGNKRTLADFKGKVVFLNFWSTSCGPCIAEMSDIEKLADSLKDAPVSFLAVTKDDEREVRNFLKLRRIGVPVYLYRDDPPGLASIGVPVTFVLDPQGRAVFRQAGAVNWNTDDVRQFIKHLASGADRL